MKILVSAIACNPTRGSEAHFGWTALRAISRQHDVWLIGHENDRRDLQAAQQAKSLAKDVKMVFIEGDRKRSGNRVIARMQNWTGYSDWSRRALEAAARLDQQVNFDIVHHVTLATWRVASPLWRLGKPFVWGPVGGGERFPLELLGTLSPTSRMYELFRSFHGTLAANSASVRQSVRKAEVILAADLETASLVERLGAKKPVELLSPAFFGKFELNELSKLSRSREIPTVDTPLRAFAGGDIEGRKGIALALEAISALSKEGVNVHYTVAGQGPETEHLLAVAAALGISENFEVLPLLDREEYKKTLARSEIYLLPSLRDSAGITMMEGMLSGLCPLVAACGGPGSIVSEETGRKVPVSGRKIMVQSITKILRSFAANRREVQHIGKLASRRISEKYSEDAYFSRISEVYEQARRRKSRL